MSKPVEYMQNDRKWKDVDYSAQGEKTTIGKAGCGPTCAAMVVASLKDKTETPVKAAHWAKANGYKAKNQGTYYTFFEAYFKTFGIKCKRLTTSSVYNKPLVTAHKYAYKALKRSDWIIACMGKGTWTKYGHFVLCYKLDGDMVHILDPASKSPERRYNTLKKWQNEVKHYFVIDVPKGKKIVKNGDDEMIENRKIAILGKDTNIKTIFKDNENYVNVKDFCEALGLEVTSSGREPIITMSTIKMKIDGKNLVISGHNANGTTYAPIKTIAEKLGKSVGWDSLDKRVIIH